MSNQKAVELLTAARDLIEQVRNSNVGNELDYSDFCDLCAALQKTDDVRSLLKFREETPA